MHTILAALPRLALAPALLPALVSSLLLSGCAGTIVRSEVLAYHDLPADPGANTYAFAPSAQQRDDPEYRRYQDLAQAELQRVGFARGPAPQLSVTLQYGASARDVRVVEPAIVDPWYGAPWYGPRWTPFGYAAPFADPFWMGPPAVVPVERQFVLYRRELNIAIVRSADAHALFQVTVHSEGSNPALAEVMPAMIKSAFVDFPGPNGVPRVVELRLERQP
jgi:hypothetical protein